MPTTPRSPLPRQGLLFVLAGCAQLALDWSAFVALTAAGMPTAVANPLARAGGAMLGFWLNGRYTFAQAGQSRLGWRRLRRFVPSWLLLTLLSTLVMVGIGRTLGLQAAWLGKPLVEAVFAAISFVVWRHWVYR